MRVLYIIPTFYPTFYHGGPAYSTYGLCNALGKDNIELRVLATDTQEASKRIQVKEFPTLYKAGYLVYFCRRYFSLSISPGLLWHTLWLIRWADLVHLTAVYSFSTIPALCLCKLWNKPVVWSSRGSFHRWQGSRRVKLKAFWEKICRFLTPRRVVIHATSQEEVEDVRKRFPGYETALIPCGVEIPEEIEHTAGNGITRLLYLGRLNPIKGVENLLAACKILKDKPEIKWRLTIAGSGKPDYVKKIAQLIKNTELSPYVKMIGEVEGEEKKRLFAENDICVIPSHTESFCMVAAEALAHGLAVIVSKGAPWQSLEDVGCGLWVNNDAKSLSDAVEKMSQMPLAEMGKKGRAWMQKDFNWEKRAEEMREVYSNLITTGCANTKPSLDVVILTYNEEANIEPCLRSIRSLAQNIFVVDSGSADRTADIARGYGALVVTHEFTTQGKQFNWALDHLPIKSEWVLRLDADEYLLPQLREEIVCTLARISKDINGLYMKRRMIFMQRWIRHGGYYPSWIMRLFRYGKARSEEVDLNEHTVLLEGRSAKLKHDFVNECNKPLSYWTVKHEDFAARQAQLFSKIRRHQYDPAWIKPRPWGNQPQQKRWLINKIYNHCPLFLRAFLYFLYRYFFHLGFLDGRPGLVFHFLHGYWYMFYTDAKIYEENLKSK